MADAERNRNALRSQRLIKEAFCSLARERGTSRIPVTDICRKADINRANFYAHYESFDDLRDKLWQGYLDGLGDWLRSALQRDFMDDPLPSLTCLGIYLLDNKPIFDAFMELARHNKKDPEGGFGMSVRNVLLPVMGEMDQERLVRFDFIASALVNTYFTWVIGAYKDYPLEELNRQMARYIRACGKPEA